jgi:MFS transporter, DHA2 family, multidrug resistance protein
VQSLTDFGAKPLATASPQFATPAPPTKAPAQLSTHPYIGILGVFLGASIATMNARLLSVGLADLRGAIGASFDAASWLPTALNMAMMFSGVFCVFLSAVFGPRRILLSAALVFTITSILLPLSSNLWVMLALLVLAGLTSGTFYSLTLTFVLTALPKRLIIFGIAAYAADIVFTSNIASALEGWYSDHLSWHWIFWTAAVFTPWMMICIYFGIPRRTAAGAIPSWRGFAYFSASLSLLYGALDQGERLDWFHSGVVVAMSAGGIFLLAATFVRRKLQPNPLVNLSFLNSRNTIILAVSIFVFKFVHLASIILVPGFLGNVQRYRATDTGHALAWVAVPQFAVVWLVAATIIFTNSRLILAAGLTIVASSSLVCAHLDSSWAGASFQAMELVLATGLACVYIGLVSSIVLVGLEKGALSSAAAAATFSGFMHSFRIFGGQVGVSIMNRFLSVREQFHSNMLGLHVQIGNWLTDERLRIVSLGVLPGSSGLEEAQARAGALLGQQLRTQAYTLAIADGFVLIAGVAAAYLIVMLLMQPAKISYQDLRRMQ